MILCVCLQGDRVYGFVGVDQVFQTTTDYIPPKGFVTYGTVDYGIADFDNLSIESSEGLTVLKPHMTSNHVTHGRDSAWRGKKL